MIMTVLAVIGAGCVLAGGYAFVDHKVDKLIEGRSERRLLKGMLKAEQEEREKRLLKASDAEILEAELELEEEMKDW